MPLFELTSSHGPAFQAGVCPTLGCCQLFYIGFFASFLVQCQSNALALLNCSVISVGYATGKTDYS